MTILDFNHTTQIWFAICTIFGVIGNELWVWSKGEDAWKWSERKGDIVFSLFFAPVLTVIGMPFFWDLLAGRSLWEIEFSLAWYNEGTSLLLGLLIIKITSLIHDLFDIIGKKIKSIIEKLRS